MQQHLSFIYKLPHFLCAASTCQHISFKRNNYIFVTFFFLDVWFGSNEVLTYKYTAAVDSGLSATDSTFDDGFNFECTVEVHPMLGCQRLLKVKLYNTWDDTKSSATIKLELSNI